MKTFDQLSKHLTFPISIFISSHVPLTSIRSESHLHDSCFAIALRNVAPRTIRYTGVRVRALASVKALRGTFLCAYVNHREVAITASSLLLVGGGGDRIGAHNEAGCRKEEKFKTGLCKARSATLTGFVGDGD